MGPNERNVCRSHKKCTVCLQLFTSTAQEHSKHCGLQYCYNCKKEVNLLQHRCYLQRVDEDDEDDEDDNKTTFINFDIEARQDEGNHIANLLFAETTLDDTQYTFKGENCVTEFFSWVHSLANDKNTEKTVVVAHNFKGYDGYFFNTVQNQIYAGYVPDKKYYDPDGMSPQRKEEFLRWHTEKVSSGYIFDFQDELLAYCQSDVRLLKEGCEKFQKEFKDICGFNPMKNCITIASACNTAYRRNWMPENKIAIKPVRGWRPTHNQSHAALKWLALEEHELSSSNSLFPRIAHARNQGERRISDGNKTYLVDGFDKETQTVYEFQGCFFHGCIACFPNRDAKHPYHTN